jgi:hypothetical protein
MSLPAFVVRPCLDGSGRPLIEFLGIHRAVDYPCVHALLAQSLPGFTSAGEQPIPDDFVWQCRFDGGEFELTEDWAGLFILPKGDAERVMATVADALVKTGAFQRTSR